MYVYCLQPNDLKNLSPDTAVKFFRRLLWAEARRAGIDRYLIDAPDCINVGDGGLDAVIENANPTSEDLIPSGLSGFQIKSSRLTPSECKKELHVRKNKQSPLKHGIKRVLDNDGTYVLVLFKEMTHERMKRGREEAIKEELQRMGYPSPKIRIYTINQIVSFAEKYLALIAWLRPFSVGCLPYSVWANNRDVSKPETFVVDENRKRIIEEMREKLSQSDGYTLVFRITGLPGIGKTRLVFETLSPEDLKNRAIYVKGGAFKNSDLFNILLIKDDLEAVIVVDECSLEDHEYFVRYFSNRGSRLTLVTISHEMSKVPLPTLHYQLEPLSNNSIKKILSAEIKGLPRNVIDRLADFASGYPRIAMLLAENYPLTSSSSEDILNINDYSLMNRLIAGRFDMSSELFRQTRKALMGLALFEKVGYKGNFSSEGQWVAGFVGIDWDKLQEIVREQKQRGIVQGEYFVYVTPFRLAIYLAREWWNAYGNNMDFGEFNKLPKEFRLDMLDRFISRFPFIMSTEPGRKRVEELLSGKGFFSEGSLLKTEIGANFFLKLTEADPKSALHCLKRTIGTWNKQQLLEFKAGRRGVVWSLERIAVWRDLFADATRLLLALGEAENESWTNNASGVFANLFSPAWGQVAPTEASLEERFPLLVEAISSDSIDRKRLALKAFNSALQCGHFSRTIGAEYQGSKPLPKLWTPKTGKEILNHYQRVWTYLEENLEKFDDEIRDEASEILMGSARGLNRVHPSLSEIVRKTIRRIASYSWIEKSRLLKTVSVIVHYDGKRMPEDVSRDWITIKDELTGSSFSDMLERYVGMNLLEDYFQTSEHYDTKWVESKLLELAEKAIKDPNLLQPEYSWLVSGEAKRGHQFGYELGKLDKEFSLLERLIDEQKKSGLSGNVSFLGGYFKALFERESSLWEEKLDLLSIDNHIKRFVPELTWCSGITDRAVKRILSMAEKEDIAIDSLRMFRAKKISEPVFMECVRFLLKEQTGVGAIISLDLIYFRYIHEENKIPPEDLTLEVLLHHVFWDNPDSVPRDQMVGYYWKETANKFIDIFPEAGSVISERIVKFLGNEMSITRSFHSETLETLLKIAKGNPNGFWKRIIEYLGPPVDRRTFYLNQWLRGEIGFETIRGALELFDPEDIWKWVNEDVENRAQHLATFVPPYLFHSDERICLGKELLVRYGDREDVRRNFSDNCCMEGWAGAASVHYMNKKKELLEFSKSEAHGNVIKWVEEHVEVLEGRIERAKMREEREGSS